MKGTFYHIDTGTKQLQMSFYTLGITYLKLLISRIIVFQMSRNRYFAQKEGLRKKGCCFAKGRFHTKGTFYFTGTKQLQMSFYTLYNFCEKRF